MMKPFKKHWMMALGLSLAPLCRAADLKHADVVIYGATPAGITAAVRAAKEGASVQLLEPSGHIGGMMTGGLGASDVAIDSVIGGLALKFFKDTGDHYKEDLAFRFEPQVASKVFHKWLAKERIRVVYNYKIDRVYKKGAAISRIVSTENLRAAGKVFIDASYEGDLMARAGVSYSYGRESRATYHEEYAGVQSVQREKQFPGGIPGKDEQNDLLQHIQKDTRPPLGAGDYRIQAYNYRLCLTDNPANRIPFRRPEGYDVKEFELAKRWLKVQPSIGLRDILMFLPLKRAAKIDLNHVGPFSTNLIGENWHYPEGTYEEREEIALAHRRYIEGLLYFLSTDLDVPEQIRLPLQRFGLAADEFDYEEGHWPHQLYIREARRMLGAHIMTEHDILHDINKRDSIGLGSHRIESHPVQRHINKEGWVQNTGDIQVRVKMKPYALPYRIITPLDSECNNLLVPVCVSASHIAYSAVRMEPQYMILGESAGMAAALAVKEKTTVQALPIKLLQKKLKKAGQRF